MSLYLPQLTRSSHFFRRSDSITLSAAFLLDCSSSMISALLIFVLFCSSSVSMTLASCRDRVRGRVAFGGLVEGR